MTTEPLHIKYRPKKLSEVVGQGVVVSALADVIKAKRSQSFLLVGPSGVGKTTIARIGARLIGAKEPGAIMEIDAATHTGVDDIRALQEQVRYKPLSSEQRAIIIDECHRLTTQAWDALLKVIEEPPPFLSWWFCTTEPGKVKDTIKTRCTAFMLTAVSEPDLGDLYDRVVEAEGITIADEMADLCIREANGSPRQLLVNLAVIRDIKTLKDAKRALASAVEHDAIIELCRFIIKGGGSWGKAMSIFKRLEGENPESVRIVVCNYMASALKGSTNDNDAVHILSILDNFSTPYNQSEGAAPLLLSIGRCRFADQA